MSYKFFGRLGGKTFASAALEATSEPNSTHKYVPAAVASKMIAYGEPGLAIAFNRALGALSANTDYLRAVLGGSAMRADMLAPERTEGGTVSGFTALTGVATGETQIDLGLGARTPVTWVYLGLHKDQMHKYVRMYRRLTGVLANVYLDATEVNEVSPTDAKINGNGGTASFFPTQVYTGSEEHALVSQIPGVSRIAADLSPYGGAPPAALAVAISSWDSDGFYCTTYSTDELYLRPGCFVEIYNENSPSSNNGLWRVEDIRRADKTDPAGDKVVLSRGGLHRVSVNSTVPFNVGERVSWRSRPDDLAASTAELREHYAYVAYIIDDDLYLANFAGGEDFKLQGGNIAYKVSENAAAYRGFKHVNHPGMIDREDSADQNWSLTSGTLLYNLSGAASTEVLDVIDAGYPVQFSTISVPGNFYGCSPLGWALNPSLTFAADEVVGGDYYVDCFTLSTVGEQLVSQGAGPSRAALEAPYATLGMSRNAMFSLHGALKFAKVGGQSLSVSSNTLNGPFTATRAVLGEQLWKLTVAWSAGAVQTVDVVPAGDILTGATAIEMTGGNTTTATPTNAVVVSAGANNELILSNVTRLAWSLEEDFTLPPIEVGSTFTHSGTTFIVTSIPYSPALRDGTGTDYYPSYGLNAAYNSEFSAIAAERNSGLGNVIALTGGRPLTLLQEHGVVGAGLDAFEVRDDRADAGIITLKQRDGTLRARIKAVGDSLTLRDTNTLSDIPFSGATPYNALPGTAASILEALHGGIVGSAGITGPWSTSVLGGATITKTVAAPFAGAGIYINASAGRYIREGQVYTSTAAPLFEELPVAGTRYVAYTPTADVYTLETTLDPSDVSKVYLHKYVTVASVLTEDIDIRMPLRRVDAKMELTVGTPLVAAYAEEVANFTTLGDAFKAIQVWEDDASGGYKVPWSIRVIGGVDEPGADLPLVIPANGMVIHGAPHSDHEIVWASAGDTNVALFNMNEMKGLVFRDLNIRFDGAACTAQPVNLERIVWDGRNGAADDWLFDNVTVTATTPSRLHGFLSTTSGGGPSTRVRIRDCNWTGASDFGVHLGDPLDVHIHGSTIEGQAINAQSATGGQGGVYFVGPSSQNTSPVLVTDCCIREWQFFGIRADTCKNVTISNTTVADIGEPFAATPVYGILFDGACDRAIVSNNRVMYVGTSADDLGDLAVGIYVDGAKTIVHGNNVELAASVLVGAGTFYGVYLSSVSSNCIATTNQTNGATLTDVGTASTVANNRDDP